MPFEPWQIPILQEKGIVDATGAPIFEMLKHVSNPAQMTHAVVRKAEDKYQYLSQEGWTFDDKAALKMSKEQADALATRKARDKALSVVFTEKVAPDAVQRLFAADHSQDHHWSEWIFEQAGGGKAARDQTDHHVNYLKQRFIHQYSAEAWAQTEASFLEKMRSADQDVMMKMRGCWGFFRDWPGRDDVYAKVVAAVEKFQEQEASLLEMNQELQHNGQPVLPALPEQLAELKALTDVNQRVTNWIAAKRVRTDSRVATWKKEKTIYSDDFITAIAPLTYAAAVKFGFDAWDVSNREKFAKVAQGELHGNPWDKFVANNQFMVLLKFNVPMPAWVNRDDDFNLYELTNLLLALDNTMSASDPDGWEVWDEENSKTLNIAKVKDIIMREATGTPPPAQPAAPAGGGWNARKAEPHPLMNPAHAAKSKNWPVKRTQTQYELKPPVDPATNKPQPGWDAQKEAQQIIQHLDMCLAEVRDWAAKFDPATLAKVVQR